MKKQRWLAGAVLAVTVGFLCAAPFVSLAAEPVPEGVFVGAESLSGLSGEEAKEKISEYAAGQLGRPVTLSVNGSEATGSAAELGLSWQNEEALQRELADTEITGNLIRRYMKKKDLQTKPVKLEPEFAADPETLGAFVSEHCRQALTEAVDAAITRENGEFVVTPGTNGTAVDVEATAAALQTAFREAGGGVESGSVSVCAELMTTEPRIQTADLETIQDVLGTFTTSFASSGAARSTNLEVGASKINGHVLMPGEVLSGYACMQPITEENGYRTATAYENGRSVDSIGGGVCQIATTLYNAALYAEMEIVQRQNHSMSVAYVKPSMDAAIAGTYKDLKFKNPYDTPVYVEGYTSGKTLTFTIYGKETRPANRTLQFESETLRTIDPGAASEQADPTLAPGQRVKVQSAHTGLQSKLYKCVYVDGELTERTLLSSDTYNASKAIYRVGPTAAAAVQAPAAAEDTAAGAAGAESQAAGGNPVTAENPANAGDSAAAGVPAGTESPGAAGAQAGTNPQTGAETQPEAAAQAGAGASAETPVTETQPAPEIQPTAPEAPAVMDSPGAEAETTGAAAGTQATSENVGPGGPGQ